MKTYHYFPEDFVHETANIYETVLVIAQRARQIGELQKRLIDRHLGQTEMLEQAAARARSEDSDEVIEPEPLDRPAPKFEKPVILAMQERRDGDIESYFDQ
jgi:DNA-directed RNA polymerase subunit K/omega